MSFTIPIGRGTLGLPVPSVLHAISSSLPTWSDSVGYSTGQTDVVDAMLTGYPRFIVHRSIQELSEICQTKFGFSGELCLLFPTRLASEQAKEFIYNVARKFGNPTDARIVRYRIRPKQEPTSTPDPIACYPSESQSYSMEVFIVFFPAVNYQIARRFWQGCGLGVSSRFAEHCLYLLGVPGFPRKEISEFMQACGKVSPSPTKVTTGLVPKRLDESRPPLAVGADAKAVLRRRIANYVAGNETDAAAGSDVSDEDVFLYPCGMSAIWNAHQLLLATRPLEKSVVFGFPFPATLQIIQHSGPGAIFYGHGRDSDIDDLEALLAAKVSENPSTPPLLALYTEIPSNPCGRTANMPRLRALADKYDFLIVIDDTIGSFANVDIMPYADIVVTSLSKYMCGYANALGGSMIINPRMKHHDVLQAHLKSTYEDTFFDHDAIAMEQNSRDYFERMRIINTNAEHVCDFLYKHSVEGGASESEGAIIKRVYYPKYMTRENYEMVRRRTPNGEEKGGYGGLCTLSFTSVEASRAFFDALQVAKGPTFGTTFTLSCPYSILTHYADLEWATEYGIEECLVRIGIGTEDKDALLMAMETALKVAGSVA